MISVLIQFSPIQSFLVRQAASILSDKLQTRVDVKSVNLSLFGNVILNGVYVEDLQHDTLIYANKITASINKLPIYGNELRISNVKLTNGKFYLRDSIELNITAIIQKLSNKEKVDTTPSAFEMRLEGVELSNFDFKFWRYDSLNITSPTPAGSVNFRDIVVSKLNVKANNFNFRSDTIFFDVKQLSLHEKSGFNMNKLTAMAYIIPGQEVHLDDIKLIDDYSDVNIKHYSMVYDGGESFADFINKVNLSAYILKSKLSVKTLGYFAHILQDIPLDVEINGLVTGTISNLKSNNLRIATQRNTLIDGRFSIMGLPDINESIIFADFRQLRTNPNDLVYILNKFIKTDFSSLQSFLTNVTQANFTGTFTGLYNDFVANGIMATNIGALNLDLLFTTGDDKEIDFSGQVSTSKFQLGKLLSSSILGNTNFNLQTNGKIVNGVISVFGKGAIAELEFNKYNYQDIKLSGKFSNNQFDGEVVVDDPNANLSFIGSVNLNENQLQAAPVFDFSASINYLNLVDLNINTRDSLSEIKGDIVANFSGSNINNFEGDLKLSDVMYRDAVGVIPIGNVMLTSKIQDDKNVLSLTSNFVDANYIGKYQFGNFVKELKQFVYTYIPNINPDKDVSISIFDQKIEPYEIRIKTKELAEAARVILPGLYIAENTDATLKIDDNYNLNLDFSSTALKLNNNKVENIKISSRNTRDTMFVDGYISKAKLAGFNIENINVNNTINKNDISTHLYYNSLDTSKYDAADINLKTSILYSKENKRNQIGFKLSPSNIILDGDQWEISESSVLIDTGRVSIKDFMFYRNNQQFRLSGVLSHSQQDTITIRMFNYDIDGFNYFTEKAGYKLSGTISGFAEIIAFYNSPLIMVNLNAKDIVINNDTLGNSTIASSWDAEYERLNVIARIFTDQGVNTSINGFVSPKEKRLSFDLDLIKLNLKHLEPLLSGIVSNIDGTASGKLALRGDYKSPDLTGLLAIEKTKLTIDYLGARYQLDADVDVKKSEITIRNGIIADKIGNKGKVDLTLNHKSFRDINFVAQASINNMLCLDTKVTDNPLFYGISYATGGIVIKGTPSEMHFNITAQAEKNSKLYIPLPKTTEVKESKMLTFKSLKDTITNEVVIENNGKKAKTKIDFSLDLTVTPETEIQILIDPLAGDILRAEGVGNLKMDINPAIDEFKMVGDYRIERGDYNFVLPSFDFITRKFNIEKGSRITFNGDIEGAVLDIVANHKARASVTSLTQDNPTQGVKRYDVNCQIFITGKMVHPNLKFNVEIPSLDPESKAKVMSIMNTDEKMTTQFLALLVMGSFIPEQQYGSGNYGATTVMNNATELLSAQIGNLISMLNLPVPLDVSVDLDVTSSQTSSVEVGISTQLFDRVIINSTVGNNTRTNRDFVGDVDIYYLLGKQGKYRIKVFTRSSDYFTDDLETNMQGAGASYQTEFDNFKELFRRKNKDKKYKLTTDLTRKEDDEEMESNNK